MEKIPENTNNKNISNGIKDHNIKKNNIREAPTSPEDEKSEAEFDFSDSDLIESDENDETNNEESNNNNNKNSFSNKLQNQSVMTNATIQTNKTAAPPDAEAINELVNSNNHTMTSDSINSPTTETNNNNNVNITNTNELNPNNKINVSIDKENINNNEILSNKKRNSSSVYLNETNCDPVNENFNDNEESNLKRPSNLDLEHLNNNNDDDDEDNDDDDEDNDDDCYNDHSIDADILASPPPFIIKNTSSSHLSTIETNNNQKDLNTIDDNNKLMEPFCPIPTTPKKFVDSMDNDDEYDENNIISNGRKFFPKNMNNSSGKLKADLSQDTNINNNNNSNKDEDQNRNIIKSTYSIGHGDGGGGGNCGNIEDDEVFYSGDYNEDNDDYDDENEDEDKIIIEFLGKANPFAEARLAARRQARAEAREIRMRELERQQKEMDQNADRAYDMQTSAGIDPLARSRLTVVGNHVGGSIGNNTSHLRTPNSGGSMSSRRSSEDSLEDEGRSIRDIRHELKDLEERFRKAMIANAQLDNERTSHTYQIELLKDQLEEKGEKYAQLQREYKEKSRESNALKRNVDKLEEELRLVKGQLDERDSLISEQGLVIVLIENEDGTDAKRALVSVENAQLLGSVQGSLDVRLKRFTEEKHQLQKEVQTLQQQVDELKSQGRGKSSMNGPLGIDDEYEAQREANKLISEFKYKLQKAEQEIASLQASLARSETQVIRYKSTAEAAEKAEAELKIERRKLQRENREASERLEELETSNNHLLKRLDKLKTAKSTLLKEL